MTTTVTVAELVGEHERQILERWFARASVVASARGLDRPEFTNFMPGYVAALARATSDLGTFTGERRAHVESHLSSRIRQGFQVEEIVDEFILVGECIRELAESREPAARPTASELDRLSTEIHRATAVVVSSFLRHMVEDEQLEKRALRRLQAVASATLERGVTPLAGRLTDAAEVIMEAMQAVSAGILLHDPVTGELVSVAATGVEEMEGFVTSVDKASFAGKVAASVETTAIDDVPTTTLSIPDSLRRSGVHSLLGVRLPPHRSLLGVLYVGIDEARPFSNRESSRLEVLGEQLALHLDGAALFAELTSSIAALRAEREIRERFVAVLAHDLRGPLTAAKLAAHLLVEGVGAVDGDARRLATRVMRNIGRTDAMVHDLLDANRIHAGERLPLRIEPCDLGVLAGDVVEELAALHGARFVLHVEEPVRGFWSADELRRAIWNLSTNAVKYGAPDRPITLNVRGPASGAELSVHNEGNPIPSVARDDLFRAFSRGPGADAGHQRGWGLGLTLVRGCATSHGGHVEVSSDAETGTTFTIRLPWDSREAYRASKSSDPRAEVEGVARGHDDHGPRRGGPEEASGVRRLLRRHAGDVRDPREEESPPEHVEHDARSST